MSGIPDLDKMLRGLTGPGVSHESDGQGATAGNIVSVPLFDPSNPLHEFLCVEKIHAWAVIPTKGSESAAGYDLYSAGDDIEIPAWQSRVIPTGIKVHLPHGTYGHIASRSGLAKKGFTVDGGIIDPDYEGEIMVILRNSTDLNTVIKKYDRIAQLILIQYKNVPIREVRDLKKLFGPTQRGIGGFGSTGR